MQSPCQKAKHIPSSNGSNDHIKKKKVAPPLPVKSDNGPVWPQQQVTVLEVGTNIKFFNYFSSDDFTAPFPSKESK